MSNEKPSREMSRTEYEAKIKDLEAKLAKNGLGEASAAKVVPGTRTYQIASRHYRAGRLYEPGELVTVTDEAPGKDWVLIDGDAKPAPAPKAPGPVAGATRSNERDI